VALERELEAALEAAQLAGRHIMKEYAAFVPIPNAPAEITTEVDRTAQELILRHLHDAFPADALCAEEATPGLQSATHTGRRVWVVDPIDGTRGFAMKNGEFSVMIGLLVGGEVSVGVVLEPALDRVTSALQGGGCWVREKEGKRQRCQVTKTTELSRAALVQSHSKPGKRSEVDQALETAKVVETYSAGVKLALVARGEVDLYVNTYGKFADWDICAGHLLVEEAGGTVTELRGGAVRYGQPGFSQRGGLVTSNGVLHATTITRLESIRWP
jgi:3'(2'), 5'-bisphosphate nucleotidase